MRQRTVIRLAAAIICALGALAAPTASAATVAGAPSARSVKEAMAALQVPFIVNRGQIDDSDVRFYARTFAGAVFVTECGRLVYSLPVAAGSSAQARWAFSESFRGSRRAGVRGSDRSGVLVSHFKGDDPNRWHSRLETFDAVELGELYLGVRVVLRAAGNNVEKLLHVAPGGSVEVVEIALDGVDEVAIDVDGRLVLSTSVGSVVLTAPEAYQIVDGDRRSVPVDYRLLGNHRYGFRVGDYDPDLELVVDPLLAATYLGGHNPNPPGNYDDDIVWGMAFSAGDLWVAGATQSPDFPVHLGYDDTLDSSYPDGFITRFTSDLSTIVASTYFGTEGFDRVADLAIAADGSVVVVGQAGYGFPVTPGAYTWSGSTPVGGGFVSRFSPDLSTLVSSAVVTPGDYPSAVELGNGSIYFGGSTNNPDFPITPGAFLSTCCAVGGFGIREYNGFAGRISADLGALQALTYLEGRTASAMAAAPDGSVFITDGFDHAITGAIERFDDDLTTRLARLSYYPGSNSGSSRTYFNDVAAGEGFVVTVGQTYMNDLPATPGAFDTTCGTDGLCDGVGPLLVPRSDGFIAIYSLDLQSTIALTYFGGSYHESIRSVALADDGGVIVAGETGSVDFPTAGPGADTGCGLDGLCDPVPPFEDPMEDGFVARLSADLSGLDFGSYLGGSGVDLPNVVAVDRTGLVYAAGRTDSADFPTTAGAFDTTYNGGTSDAFIALFDTGVDGGALIFADDFETGDLGNWGHR